MQAAPRNPVPVLPLPEVVLFPHATLSLHVFAVRYRTLVRDALSSERLVAVALLKPGWEQAEQTTHECFPLGCLARFEEVEWLPNDCFDLKLLGLSRIRLERVIRDFPYRSARLELLPEAPYAEDDPLVEMEKQALLEVSQRWLAGPAQDSTEAYSWSREQRYETLVNALCSVAVNDPLERLGLLELDSVLERGRRVREITERRLRQAEPPAASSGEHN